MAQGAEDEGIGGNYDIFMDAYHATFSNIDDVSRTYIYLLANVAEIQKKLRITKINLWSLLATRGKECIYIPL